MAETNEITSQEATGGEKHHVSTIEHVQDINNALTQVDAYQDDSHVRLGWRSWLVVFVTLYR